MGHSREGKLKCLNGFATGALSNTNQQNESHKNWVYKRSNVMFLVETNASEDTN